MCLFVITNTNHVPCALVVLWSTHNIPGTQKYHKTSGNEQDVGN